MFSVHQGLRKGVGVLGNETARVLLTGFKEWIQSECPLTLVNSEFV